MNYKENEYFDFQKLRITLSLWKSSFDSEIREKNMKILDIMSDFLLWNTYRKNLLEVNGRIQNFKHFYQNQTE